MQWAEIDGRKYHVVGGKVSHAVVNPTFDPIAKAGAMHDYFRGNPDGRNPLEFLARARADPARVPRPRRRASHVLDEQGLDAVWLFPTLGMLYEELLKHDPEARRASRSARSTAGSTRTGASTTEDRIFAAPYITLADLDWAVERARVGARPRRRASIVHAPGRADHDRVGPAHARRPDVRPVLGARERGRHHRRRARGRQRLLDQRLRRRRLRGRASGGGRPSRRSRRSTSSGPIYDFLVSLVFDKLFDRFPNLRVASVENGAEFLPDLFHKLRSIDRKMPGYFTEDPVETFRRHIWINPFWEDDVDEVVELMGADRVIFGSDWPHIEGMPEPARLRGRSSRSSTTTTQRLILRDNAEELNVLQAGLNPSNIRRMLSEHRRGDRRRRASRGSSDALAAMRLDGRVAVDEAVGDLEADARVVPAAHAEALPRHRARLVGQPPDERRHEPRVPATR